MDKYRLQRYSSPEYQNSVKKMNAGIKEQNRKQKLLQGRLQKMAIDVFERGGGSDLDLQQETFKRFQIDDFKKESTRIPRVELDRSVGVKNKESMHLDTEETKLQDKIRSMQRDRFISEKRRGETPTKIRPPKPSLHDRVRIINAKQRDAAPLPKNEEVIKAFKNKQPLKGRNFESTGSEFKLFGHVIARHVPNGLEVSNAGYPTSKTYDTLRALGINTRIQKGVTTINDKEIDPNKGDFHFVPSDVISSEKVYFSTPEQRQKMKERNTNKGIIDQRRFREQTRERVTGYKTQIPLSQTQIQPHDQKIINEITGVKSPLGQPVRATEQHHILFKEKFPGLKNNPNNAIPMERTEHDELHRLNPMKNYRKFGKLQRRLTKLAGIFGPDPADPDYAIETADYDTQRKMSEIEYPLVRKTKHYRENKFKPTFIPQGDDPDVGHEGFTDTMKNIPASRVTGTSPKGTSELDFGIRERTMMDDFKPKKYEEGELEKELESQFSGPFKKHLRPHPSDVEVDYEEDWNLDEYYESGGEELNITGHTSTQDNTMKSIYNLLEESDVYPEKREQAKIKLMQYMPIGDNNVDDMLDYILENGIDSMSSSNIFGISKKNAGKYSQLIPLKLKIAGIKELINKKKIDTLKKKNSVKQPMIQTAKHLSADAIIAKFKEVNPDITNISGVFDPIEGRVLDANIPRDKVRLQNLYESGDRLLGFNSITDTRKGPNSDLVLTQKQLRDIENAGGVPALGFDNGSLEAVRIAYGKSDQDILDELLDHQNSTGILDPNTEFRIVDNPKYKQ